ncbi:leucine-rich repeat domain-containing protein [Salinibius halmophilus]|uniref:hypothetical protein n=1 Tax=Salinibius halmophilus TaxID=1853216 RepID=UPI000E66150B|nr:hypothetical protein [Salinibius halmophilus]
MKHLILAALSALVLSGCYVSTYPPADDTGYPTYPTSQPTSVPTGIPSSGLVSDIYFADANLRACVSRTGVYYVNQLTRLECPNQSIRSTTGIRELTALRTLNLRNNPINLLDVRGLPLVTLDVSNDWQNGMLSYINMGGQEALRNVNISGNNFSAFSTQWMPALTSINFSYNSITQMDFSSNRQLETLHGRDNQLTSISVANGPLTNVDLQNNLLRAVYFPNPWSLREANLANNRLYQFGAYDTRRLDYLNLANNDFTEFALPDYVGDLVLDGNQLRTLNASNNSELRNLSVANNQLSSIWLPAQLQYLNVANNQLASIQLPRQLTFADVSNNRLTEMNADIATLDTLNVDGNSLAYMDIRTANNLVELSAQNAGLSNVNLTENPALVNLDLDNNDLQSLLTDYNPQLQDVSANDNRLTSALVDFRQQQALRSLSLRNNDITELRLDYSKYLSSVDLRGNRLTGKTVEHLNGLGLDKLNY